MSRPSVTIAISMRFSAFAITVALSAGIPGLAAADDAEGIGLHDEVGAAISVIDGEAAPYLRNPVLTVAVSVSIILPSEHGVGFGVDFAWDVSGADGTIGTYFLDLFYLHGWRPLEHWEVTPLIGVSVGWVDATLASCTGMMCSDEAMMFADQLDELDAFTAGGKAGVSVALVKDFIQLGASTWVRVMMATGQESWNVLWSQAFVARVGFRFDL